MASMVENTRQSLYMAVVCGILWLTGIERSPNRRRGLDGVRSALDQLKGESDTRGSDEMNDIVYRQPPPEVGFMERRGLVQL